MVNPISPRWVFPYLYILLMHAIFSLHLLNIAIASPSLEDPVAQQKLDKVLQLPGQDFNVSFAHYSGYVNVNEESGHALFYWFVEAVEDPQSKPLVLWLNGGPGCSSIAYGMAEEIGPFHIKPDGKNLYLNPYSWNQAANLLFLDAPVGVGFSYSNTSSDVLANGDKKTALESLIFLLKWLDRFPQYKKSEFYLTGESYAGHYVPQLSQAIVRYNKASKRNAINLRGYMVGNALTDDYNDHLGLYHFLWSSGLISDQTFRQLNRLCDFESFIHSSKACEEMGDIAGEEIGNIDQYSIYTPPCTANVSQLNLLPKRMHRVGRISQMKYDPCTEAHSIVYFNLPEVQKALHVSPKFAPSRWETCSGVINQNWKDSPRSVLDIYRELIHSGLRIWMFSGDTDAIIPVTSTRYSIDALKLPTVKPWHAWYDDGQVGGWSQEYAGLTFVAVRGAGHEVPLHKPKLALTLIKSFLSGTSMPTLETVVHDPFGALCSFGIGSDFRARTPRGQLHIEDAMVSGDTDAVIPVTSTRYSIDALKLPTVKPWHAWYDDGQVGGWSQEYAGLTFVAVRGAGHEVPLHKPKLALTLIKSFLSGTSMPTLETVSDS